MSRLIDDMEREAGRLERLASGYRMAGETVLAGQCRTAAQALHRAVAELKRLTVI